ncbi:hypothetical protein ACMC56_05520 [Campylobacterota bacterium DY0563]
MKILIFLIIFTSLIFGDIQYTQKFVAKDIKLHLIHIDKNDTLNLRAEPSNMGKVIKEIPFNASSLITKGKIFNNWVNINYLDILNNKTYSGWVYSKYISPNSQYKFIKYKDFTVSYPFFLHVNYEDNNWINFKYTIPFQYTQYEDGRYGEKEQNNFDNINLSLKIYKTFDEVIKDNLLLKDFNFSKREYGQYEPLQKIKNGFTVRLGHEGVGKKVFIINHKNHVLVYYLKYNINKITPLEKNKDIYIYTEEDKIKIIDEITNLLIIDQKN